MTVIARRGLAAASRSNAGGVGSPSRRVRRPGLYLFVLPAALFLLAFIVYPIIFNILTSFQEATIQTLLAGGVYVGLENYAAILSDPAFAQSVISSLVFGVVSFCFQFLIGFGLALFYNRRFPLSRLLRGLYLAIWTVPIVVWGSIFRWMLDGDYGVVNWILRETGLTTESVYWLAEPNSAIAGVILANVWRGIPFYLVLILAGLQGIPAHLYEAARIDGAGPVARFAHITLPLLMPSIMATSILGLILNLKDFDLVWVMTQGGPLDATNVLPVLSYKLTFQNFEFGHGAAVLNILFIGLFILALGYLRLIRREERFS